MAKENIGKKWTELEETQLLEELRNGTELDDIANLHQRTLGGIRARINKLAHIYLKEGMDVDKIADVLRLDKLELDYLNKKVDKTKVVVQKLNANEEVVVEDDGSYDIVENGFYQRMGDLENKIDGLQNKIDGLNGKIDEILVQISKLVKH